MLYLQVNHEIIQLHNDQNIRVKLKSLQEIFIILKILNPPFFLY